MSWLSAAVLASVAVFSAPVLAAEVVFLGERHDNPHHHAWQADQVAEIAPRAVVFEMLTADHAAQVTPDLVARQDDLQAALEWEDRGWPDFAMYYPIFAAAPQARVYGAAVPREAARAAMFDVVGAFGGDAARFGLADPLPAPQQAEREAMQQAAHCNALPEEMLPMMVSVQRLRDAELARVAEKALRDTGGPVVVITGNGHARTDWGAPAALRLAAPDIPVRALGAGELDAPPAGIFDATVTFPAVERGDPCEAFRNRD